MLVEFSLAGQGDHRDLPAMLDLNLAAASQIRTVMEQLMDIQVPQLDYAQPGNAELGVDYTLVHESSSDESDDNGAGPGVRFTPPPGLSLPLSEVAVGTCHARRGPLPQGPVAAPVPVVLALVLGTPSSLSMHDQAEVASSLRQHGLCSNFDGQLLGAKRLRGFARPQ